MTSLTARGNYSGQLLRLKSEEPFPDFATRLDGVKYLGIGSSHGWHMFEWKTDFQVGGDAQQVPHDGDEFLYPLLIREVEERFMLASTHSDIVQQFLNRNRLNRSVERPLIDIAGLVRHSIFPDGQLADAQGSSYRMGALYAAVDGFGRSLRTISLFGDDLGNAGLVRDIVQYLNPFRVTLRDVRTEQEVLSVSTQGEISFYYRGAASLDAVDRALAYVRRGNFINWRLKS